MSISLQEVALKSAMRARIPAVLVGAPGTTKTATIRSIAKEMNYELITLIGSQMDPTDIVGLPKGAPVMEAEDGTPIFGTVNLAPWWQVKVLQKKKVILFLDEFSNTSPATRASMLTLLQNREFPNGETMPKETIVIGAMNPTDQAADGYDLDSPTTNRILWISWSPTMDAWIDGMNRAWNEKVSDEEMRWRRLITRFIMDNPSYLHRENSTSSNPNTYGINESDPSDMTVYRNAWASRRSWDNLAKVLPFAGDRTEAQDLVAFGLIGASAGTAFRDWLRKNDIIHPEDVIENPASVNWKSISLNDVSLILRSVVELIDDDNAPKVLALVTHIIEQGKGNYVAPYFQDMTKKLSNLKVTGNDNKQYIIKEILPKINEYLRVDK